MDLKDLTPNLDDLVVELKHPSTGKSLKNDDGSVMTITMFAPHSKEYKRAQHDQINKRLSKANKGLETELDYSDIEQAALEVLAQATKSWNLTYNGEVPKCTVVKAKAVYAEVFWIKDQLEEVANNSLDFMKA